MNSRLLFAWVYQEFHYQFQHVPIDEIFAFELYRDHWDESVIRNFLNHLTPENMKYDEVSSTLIYTCRTVSYTHLTLPTIYSV